MRTAIGIVIALVVTLFAANLMLFTVSEVEQVVVTQFGKPKRVITAAGLHYKMPFIEKITVFDRRLLDYDSAADPIFTKDKK
ncbi:MAG TPA: protease modulator HflC, partial [Candidatus Latescibacteria bacterium]|nr:protease modulator HflC [Candidatus Latescibacterota bacterium]